MSQVQSLRAPTRLDLSLMLMTALIWASAFVAIRFAVPETGPVWLAAIRVGLGFLVLLPYAHLARHGLAVRRRRPNWDPDSSACAVLKSSSRSR